MKRKKHPLVGQFFHSLNHGVVEYQGRVLAEVVDGFFIIMTYSWLDGAPYKKMVVHIQAMGDWFLYDTADEMRESYENGPASAIKKS